MAIRESFSKLFLHKYQSSKTCTFELCRFYGAEERIGENSMPQYIIVMSYVPLGTLTQFLKENTIDWFTLCRMYHSTASGLAHLHSDIVKGGKFVEICILRYRLYVLH